MNKPRKNTGPVVLKAGDRTKVLGKIPKPGRDFIDCCYTSCSRCR